MNPLSHGVNSTLQAINLLPKSVQVRLAVRYYLGLVAALLFLISLALGAGVGLLVPSYFLAINTAESSERYLSAVEDTLGIKEKNGASAALTALKERVGILALYGAQRPITLPILAALERALPENVSIRKIGLTELGAEQVAVAVSGIAVSRGDLLVFIDALEENATFSGVSVPVTQLAGEDDINFSLTFSYITP